MGRPLRSEWTKDIVVHYIEKDGSESEATLLKQVGYNKYVVKDTEDERTIVRLVDKQDYNDKKEPLTGYVEVTHVEDSTLHYLQKLTKHLITCFDAVYTLDVVLTDDGIEFADDAVATIEMAD